MKLKKLLCLVLTLAMVATTFTAFTITTTAATPAISVNYDLINFGKRSCAPISHAREYVEYKTGDDVSSLGAYSAHNMVFDGGKEGGMTYLSPNPLGYWTDNWANDVALDYGGYGPNGISGTDVSYIMYKVKSNEPITSLQVKLYGATAVCLNNGKNGGWAQMAVFAFGNNPADKDGKIDFSSCMPSPATNCVGDMQATYEFYGSPRTFDLTESALQAGFPTEMYVVVACLASGHILEEVDNRLSGYGGTNGAPVVRLCGIDIFTSGGNDYKTVYVRSNGNDSNDGLSEATAVKTVAKANQLAAALSPDKVTVNIPSDMLKLKVANEYKTAKLSVNDSAVKQYFPGVAFWGDSLTAGVSGTGYDGQKTWNPYPEVFGNLVKSNLISDFAAVNRANFGIGGENAATIVARSNAIPAVVASNVSIPASGASSSFTINLKGYSDTVTPLMQSSGVYTGDVSKVTINGISGTLKRSGEKYTFTRDTAGSASTAAAGTQIVFTAGNQFDNTNYIPVVFMGYNDGADNVANNTAKYFKFVDAILNKYPQAKNNGRYIVITPHFAQNKVDVAKKVEAAYAAKYGDHLIKTREFMSTYGPYEMGINPDSSDFASMADGKIPNCLMSMDNIHYSASGFTIVAKLIYTKMYELGYFNEIISAGNIDTSKWGGPVIPDDPDDPDDPHNPHVDPVNGFIPHSDTAKLSVNINYDMIDFGKRGVASIVKENKFVDLDSTNCNKYGADYVHHLFIDGCKTSSAMTYIHPGNYDRYDSSYKEDGNAIEVDFTNPSTVTSAYDFSYIAYTISAGKDKSLATLNVNLYGALWPSVIIGEKNDCRYQMAVYVTNKLPDVDTGIYDFSDENAICVFAKGDQSKYPNAYSESDCYKIDCSSALAKLGNESDVNVVVVLACTGFGVGASTDRLSPYQTTTSLRYTGIKIDATAKNVKPDEHPDPEDDTTCKHTSTTFVPATEAGCKVPGNTAYYKCNNAECGKLFSDSACQNVITLEFTVIPAAHKNTYYPTEEGHVAVCSECGEQGTLEPHQLNEQNVCTICEYEVTPACKHTSVTTYAAKPASCKEAGNIAYYKCNQCNKYFSDSDCKYEITLASTVIPMTSHSYGNAYVSNAQGHWQACSACGTTTQVTAHTPNTTQAGVKQYCITCDYVIDPGPLPVKPGDVNGDNKVTALDVKYLIGYNALNDIDPTLFPVNPQQNLDYNNDGSVDGDDVIYLINYLTDDDGKYPLYPNR